MRRALVAAAGLALLVAAGVGLARVTADPPAAPLPELAVLDDGFTAGSSGFLVLSVELRDRGAGVTVRSAALTASPVLQPATVDAPARVGPGRTARLVAVVRPDCRALGPGESVPLEAALVVRVAPATGAESDLRLDLGTNPVLVGRLRRLCAEQGRSRRGVSVGFVSAGFDRVDADIGVKGSDGADEVGAVELRAIEAPGLRIAPLAERLPAQITSGAGVSLRVRVTVGDCAAVVRPTPGGDPVAHPWGEPTLQLIDPLGRPRRLRPDPAAVSAVYSAAVRQMVENACSDPPR